MPPELKSSLEAEAKTNGRSLNAEIVYRLEQTMEVSMAAQLATGGSATDTAEQTMLMSIQALKSVEATIEEGLKVMYIKMGDE